jgi:3-deoxy-D-manno-octulosonic-acid transferase
VLHGPHTGSVEAAARLLAEASAAERVVSAAALAEAAVRWLSQPGAARQHAARGARILAEHRGSTQRTLAWIDAAIAQGAHR